MIKVNCIWQSCELVGMGNFVIMLPKTAPSPLIFCLLPLTALLPLVSVSENASPLQHDAIRSCLNFWECHFQFLSKINISCLSLWYAYCYFPENMTYAVLFREVTSINYWNLFRTIRPIFEKLNILFIWVHFKGPFLKLSARTHIWAYQKRRFLNEGA
jgi:hypothetical protein